MGLVLFGLRKNTHTPVSGSAVPSVANTRLIRVLEGEGATPVRSISAVGMAAKWEEQTGHKTVIPVSTVATHYFLTHLTQVCLLPGSKREVPFCHWPQKGSQTNQAAEQT